MTMLDDFFSRAIIAGIGVALIAGPLGCLIIWRGMAYFGDTLAHAALLGVAFAFIAEIDITLSVFAVSIFVALLLFSLQERAGLSTDAILGLLSHSALAIGLVALAFLTWVRVDLHGLLFGDILAVSKTDIATIWICGAIVLLIMIYFWRSLFVATVNYELAKAEGLNPERANLVFILLLSTVIAFAMKIVGVLLITALLIIPAAAARRFSPNPEIMAVLAAIIGTASVLAGLWGSLQWDTPAGPTIIVSAFFIFLIGLGLPRRLHNRLPNRRQREK